MGEQFHRNKNVIDRFYDNIDADVQSFQCKKLILMSQFFIQRDIWDKPTVNLTRICARRYFATKLQITIGIAWKPSHRKRIVKCIGCIDNLHLPNFCTYGRLSFRSYQMQLNISILHGSTIISPLSVIRSVCPGNCMVNSITGRHWYVGLDWLSYFSLSCWLP